MATERRKSADLQGDLCPVWAFTAEDSNPEPHERSRTASIAFDRSLAPEVTRSMACENKDVPLNPSIELAPKSPISETAILAAWTRHR